VTTNRKNKYPKFDIILLGDLAAGKTIHGQILAKRFNLLNLDMGKELRALESKQKYSKIFHRTMNQGKLTPTKIVQDILEQKIRSSKSKYILFNGTPKMLSEAKLITRLLKECRPRDSELIVLYLSISKAEMLRRTAVRRESVGKKVVKRADDTKEALENRFKYYKEHIIPVVDYLKKRYPFVKIDTSVVNPKVNQRKILKVIDELIH
jgi:UMP-CMP kinase